MAQEIPPNERINWKGEEKKILIYSFIDTSPGQSGSPILGMGPNDVIGVHRRGSTTRKKNWGTCLDWNKLKWIADTLKVPIQEDSNQFRLGIYMQLLKSLS
jgi:V8-like Glu-specific endopeptidase